MHPERFANSTPSCQPSSTLQRKAASEWEPASRAPRPPSGLGSGRFSLSSRAVVHLNRRNPSRRRRGVRRPLRRTGPTLRSRAGTNGAVESSTAAWPGVCRAPRLRGNFSGVTKFLSNRAVTGCRATIWMCSDTDRARGKRLGACLAGAGAELAAGAPAQPLPTREPLRAAAASSSAHASIIRPFNLNRRESFSLFINVMLSCCHAALAYARHYIRMSVNSIL